MCSHSALNLLAAVPLSLDIFEGARASRPPTGPCNILLWELGFLGVRAPRRGWAGPCPQGVVGTRQPWMLAQDGLTGDGAWAGHTLPHCGHHIPPWQVRRATGWDIQQVGLGFHCG